MPPRTAFFNYLYDASIGVASRLADPAYKHARRHVQGHVWPQVWAQIKMVIHNSKEFKHGIATPIHPIMDQ